MGGKARGAGRLQTQPLYMKANIQPVEQHYFITHRYYYINKDIQPFSPTDFEELTERTKPVVLLQQFTELFL